MERDNFNPYKSESSADSSSEKKDEKDSKKKTKSASGLGKLLAQHETNPDENLQDEPKKAERPVPSFLDKLVKPVETSEDSSAEQAADALGEQEDESTEVPLESLTPDEQLETAQSYIQNRLEQADTSESSLEDQAAESFLAAVDERLAVQPEGSVDLDSVLDDAFEQATNEINEQDDTAIELEQDDTAELEPQNMDEDESVPVAPPAAGQSGGGIPPSVPPRGGGFTGPFTGGPVGGGPTTATTSSVRQFNQTPSTTTISNQEALSRERQAMGRGVLVGGIVGYLIGRRRGRIKTEKRLKTVQEKLEKQVLAVQEKIEAKEHQIRTLVRERQSLVPEPVAARERHAYQRTEERAEAHSSQLFTSHAERSIKKPETTKTAIEGLSKEELLAFSAQIRVGETNLRRIFEAEMIDERALKRLIYEYQAGHDVRRALAREFLAKELKFERDPNLRDILPPELQPAKRSKSDAGASPSRAGGGLLGSMAVDYSPETPVVSGVAKDTAAKTNVNNTSIPLQRKQSTVPTTVLVGLTIATILLALYAVWLTANR